MGKYESAILEGADTRSLVGMALKEYDADFCYDIGSGSLTMSLAKKRVDDRREKTKQLVAELEEWEKKTPEEYRGELLRKYRTQARELAEDAGKKRSFCERATKTAGELESMDIRNAVLYCAVKKLKEDLHDEIRTAKEELETLMVMQRKTEKKVSELTEWSEETRQSVEMELERNVLMAKRRANALYSTRLAEAKLEGDLRTAEAFKELFGEHTARTSECEETPDRE